MSMTRKLCAMTLVVGMMAVSAVNAMPKGFTDDYEAALKAAKERGTKVLAIFSGSDWCCWCMKLDEEVLSKSDFVTSASKNFELVYLDFPNNEKLVSEKVKAQNRKLSSKFGISGFPTVLILSPDEEIIGTTGYQSGGVANYLEHLKILVAKGPFLMKHIDPFKKKMTSIIMRFQKEARNQMETAKTEPEKDFDKNMKALTADMVKELEALKEEFKKDEAPKEIRKDKAEFLKDMDSAIKHFKKMERTDSSKKKGRKNKKVD